MERFMCDDTLIKQAQSGDSVAFARLLEWVYDIIFRFAFKWAGDKSDAEDITQMACVKLARVISQFRFESAFTSWLYRLVINCAHDWRRKERPELKADLASTEEPVTSSRTVEASSELDQVLQRVDSMGKDFKETLLLVLAEGLTHAEAAQVLDTKESTISWRIHEIRKRLNVEACGVAEPSSPGSNSLVSKRGDV